MHMLLSAAGGAALCRLHAFCYKLYHEHVVVSKACSSFRSSAHALCTLACSAVFLAEHARSLDSVRWAIAKHGDELTSLLQRLRPDDSSSSGDRSAQDSPRGAGFTR